MVAFIELMPEISARNVFKGKVKKVTHGTVNSEIIVELPGGIELVSIITRASAERLKLKEGKDVAAIIKATNIMLATGFWTYGCVLYSTIKSHIY